MAAFLTATLPALWHQIFLFSLVAIYSLPWPLSFNFGGAWRVCPVFSSHPMYIFYWNIIPPLTSSWWLSNLFLARSCSPGDPTVYWLTSRDWASGIYNPMSPSGSLLPTLPLTLLLKNNLLCSQVAWSESWASFLILPSSLEGHTAFIKCQHVPETALSGPRGEGYIRSKQSLPSGSLWLCHQSC